MKELLKEKILLEEPEDDLPPAQLDEPVVISTEVEEEKSDLAPVFNNMIATEISNVYNNISDLNSILLTISADHPERIDIIDILNEIIDERTVHVGMLQTVMGLLGSDQAELVKTGEEVAQSIAGEPEANELDK